MSDENDRAIREFFDGLASTYAPSHGSPSVLIQRHIQLIRRHCGVGRDLTLLDIGCGPGLHLELLGAHVGRGIGVDLSEQMIARAQSQIAAKADNLEFRVDHAAGLRTIPDNSVDRVISVGALEHMPEKQTVLRSVARVLRNGGRFLCLTGNGDYLWHTRVAPALRLNSRHLQSDRFVSAGEVPGLLSGSGLRLDRVGYWRFVPSGDMPHAVRVLMRILSAIGSVGWRRSLWGGLYFVAVR